MSLILASSCSNSNVHREAFLRVTEERTAISSSIHRIKGASKQSVKKERSQKADFENKGVLTFHSKNRDRKIPSIYTLPIIAPAQVQSLESNPINEGTQSRNHDDDRRKPSISEEMNDTGNVQ